MGNVNFRRIGVVGILTAQLVTGCVTSPETSERAVGVTPDNPAHITIGASTERGGRTGGAAILALPDGQLAAAEPAGASRAHERLAALQATVPKAAPTKAMAFATLSDGPLTGVEIRALFTGLTVLTDDGVQLTHRFGRAGRVDGAVELVPDARSGQGTVQQDSGRWEISENSRLCMDWFDWYSGDRTCYSVIKSGSRILLSGDTSAIRYEILN